ncbi:MAG TPA: UDP-N-acetylmuramate dehydrogenase [Candidatus Koribacter sp.]|jgi:UDP-N-acetylmuramate dehydrogenase
MTLIVSMSTTNHRSQESDRLAQVRYHDCVHSLLEEVPLAPLTTLGVGGKARFFIEAKNTDDVRQAVDYARFEALPLFVLGGGSNLVVADSGFPGLVIHMKITGVTQHKKEGRVIYEAGAGEDWDAFVGQTVAAGYGGIECLSGIPGTVGGTPVQNVGAYGQEVSETIARVTVFDRESGVVRILENAECGFAYRTSMFNTTHRDRFVVLQVAYALTHGAAPKIEYADLKKYFESKPTASLRETRDAVREIRRRKGMLLVEGDPDVRSAGSFFKNPIVPIERFLQIDAEMQARGIVSPRYAVDEKHVKLSAAWLVEKAGFQKGYEYGNVGISTKHTLAIVNRDGGTAADVISLMNVIRDTVFSRFQVDLHPEPVFIGFENSAVTR